MITKRFTKFLAAALTVCTLMGSVPAAQPVWAADTDQADQAIQDISLLKFSKDEYNIVCGSTFDLAKYIVPDSDKPVKRTGTWKSSSPSYASVDSKGKVTAKKSGKDVTITYKEGEETAKCVIHVLFKDVKDNSEFWFKPANFLASKGIVKGYENNTLFVPTNNCTRAQMVTFLYRFAGEPETKTKTSKFPDVKEKDYFFKPVLWAVEKGITTGYKDGTFKPQNVCTRAQTVTFLWRMAGKPDPKTTKNPFPDVKKSDYFYNATLWASGEKILAGLPNGKFDPQGKCLRRQMVTFLYKYDKYVNGTKDTMDLAVDDNNLPTPTPDPAYYIENDTLYINRIYYSVSYAVGQNKYVYETPWESKKERDTYKHIVARATMICTKDESKKGKEYVNLSGLFMNMNNIESADVILNLNGVRDASFMFAACDNLKSARVILNGKAIDNVTHMFEECKSLGYADVDFGNDRPEKLKRMFYGCKSLTQGTVNMNGSKAVENCYEMYCGCSSITSVKVDFDITPDTSFGMMFCDCDKLNYVNFGSVKVTKGGQNMFNNINSMTSYTFAEDWDVDIDALCDPIGDDYMKTIVIPLKGNGGVQMFEFHLYSKNRPEWVGEYNAKVYGVDDWLQVYKSQKLDIFFSGTQGKMEFDITDVVGVFDDALADAITKKLDNEYGDALGELKDCRDDINLIWDEIKSFCEAT